MKTDHLMGSPHSVRITESRRENDSTVVLGFDLSYLNCEIHPGEFLMVWIPGVDEIPMSVSSWTPPIAEITVKSVGEATRELSSFNKGDWIGVRGPFGSQFDISAEHPLLIGGGIGIAPLRLLAQSFLRANKEIYLIAGAKTETELVLYDFEIIDDDRFHLIITTDDGSMGKKGYATDIAQELLKECTFDKMYTCGPEIMMFKLHLLAKQYNVKFEASLERYMKCGCGICGTCGIDPCGELVCIDGPIFSGNQLDKMSDFGRSYRDSTGQKKSF